MNIKLVAVDLDGTLLGGTAGRYGFLPAGIEALREMVREQTRVGIATGRDLPFILDLLEREGIAPDQEGWPHVIVAEERYIYYLDADGQYRPDTDWNRTIRDQERSQFPFIVDGISALLAGELSRVDARSFRVVGATEEQRGFVEVRFSDADAARAGGAVISAWLMQTEIPYTAVRNVAGIAIRHEAAGKGRVLLEACRSLRFAPSEALVIGDSSNDLSMLAGGLGFIAAAPGNAEIEVREQVERQGGYIAAGCYGEGVAEAIRHMKGKIRAIG